MSNKKSKHFFILLSSMRTTPHFPKANYGALAWAAWVMHLNLPSQASSQILNYKRAESKLKKKRKKSNRSFTCCSFFCWNQKLTLLIAFKVVQCRQARSNSRIEVGLNTTCPSDCSQLTRPAHEEYLGGIQLLTRHKTLTYFPSVSTTQICISEHLHIKPTLLLLLLLPSLEIFWGLLKYQNISTLLILLAFISKKSWFVQIITSHATLHYRFGKIATLEQGKNVSSSPPII